jgi:cytosine/adenosine deaminase-related metal-dependent hydrolase
MSATEIEEFRFKLRATQSVKRLLVSAGPPEAKKRLLPLIAGLAKHNIEVFATPGTARFLAAEGVAVTEVRKIAEGGEPNIKTLLKGGILDCVINILTGDIDYDESSDSRIIRSLSVQSEIPIFTDVAISEEKLGLLLRTLAEGGATDGWDLKARCLDQIRRRGGFANHHGHFDKAFLINPENLVLSQSDMQKKWYLYRFLKESYTYEDLYTRISRCVDGLIRQGCTYTRTLVDADSIVKTLPLDVALDVKEAYRDRIQMDVGIQPLEGVLDRGAREFFEKACERADFVGGLPSRDRPQPEKHLDIVMKIAKELGKPLDVHVDQENNPEEDETELLALKTIENEMHGRVFGVHCISLAAKSVETQIRIIKLMQEAKLQVICCPSAALSMKSLEKSAPLHNSIAPVPRLLEYGIPVYLGVDNIADLFMPFVDGDMWVECRLLMEACRHYDVDAIVDIATRRLPWE